MRGWSEDLSVTEKRATHALHGFVPGQVVQLTSKQQVRIDTPLFSGKGVIKAAASIMRPPAITENGRFENLGDHTLTNASAQCGSNASPRAG